MQTSLIQSYMDMAKQRAEANTKAQPQNKKQDDLRTHVVAYKPIGKLVETDSIGIKSAIRNDINSLKYFVDGIQGKGNDYSVGRINDVAIKLGSLGIAGILATTKGSPLTKGMEFVGLASWFAAMSLWPKLAIHTPIKLTKGVDLSLEYETSSGRRKSFYEDPQFICWDLISDEKINEMGDKMGIPKDIKNRRKAVENKAKQIAVQGNTLALLTAGFATPLAASLAADTLARKLVTPSLEKLQDLKAQNLQSKMMLDYEKTITNQADIDFINKTVPETLTDDVKKQIKKYFTQKVALSKNNNGILSGNEKIVAQTIDELFENSGKNSAVINLDNKLADKLVAAIEKSIPERYATRLPKENLKQEFLNLAKLYGEKVTDTTQTATGTTLTDYIYDANEIVKKMRLSKYSSDAQKALNQALEEAKISTVTNTDKLKKQLTNLSEIINTYNLRIEKDLNNFVKNTMRYDSSINARVWEKASEDVLKAFNFKLSDIKNMESMDDTRYITAVLSEKCNDIVNSEALFEKTIKKLGKIAENANTKTNQYIDFALNYADAAQKTISMQAYDDALQDLSKHFSTSIANERKYILSNYMSANGTMFTPIRALNALKSASQIDGIDDKTLKSLVFNSQTLDHFINKLESLKDKIKTQDDFNKYVNLIFSPLDETITKHLPGNLSAEINKNSKLLKAILTNLNDGTNTRFYSQMNSNEIIHALRHSKLEKYVDEYFDINLNNQGAIVDSIKNKIREFPDKIEELRGFLKLSDSDISGIKSGDFSAIDKSCFGNYLKNGDYRIKNLIDFLGDSSKDMILSDITVNKAKTIKSFSVIPPTFTEFIKDCALKVAPHKAWVKRIGISFVALCAVTAYALTKIGKKNEYNPDKYIKKVVA